MPEATLFGPETHALYGIEYARAAIQAFGEFLQERDVADRDGELIESLEELDSEPARQAAKRLRAVNLKNLFLRHEVLSQQIRLDALQGIVGALGFAVWSDDDVLKFFEMGQTLGLAPEPMTQKPLGRGKATAVHSFGRLSAQQRDQVRREFQAKEAGKA